MEDADWMNEQLLFNKYSDDPRYKNYDADRIWEMVDRKIAWSSFQELRRLGDIREVSYNIYLMSWGICSLLFLILLVLFFKL